MHKLTKPGFDFLLDWLGNNKDEAGEKYEHIRACLIDFFSWRGRSTPEDLADQVINIVIGKLPDLARSYEGDPVKYFLGVARMLTRQRNPNKLEAPLSPEIKSTEKNIEEFLISEDINRCREKCFDNLSNAQKELLTNYYKSGGKQDKIFREKFAADNQMSFETLRVTISRIRKPLRECLKKCREKT